MNNTFPMCTKKDLHFTAGNSNCVGPTSEIQASQRNQCLLGVRSTELKQRDVGQYYDPDSFEQCSSWSEILVNGSRLRLQPFGYGLHLSQFYALEKPLRSFSKTIVQKTYRIICGLQVSFLER